MKIILTTFIAVTIAILSFGQCLGSEQEFKDYFKNHISTLDPIEGIWSLSVKYQFSLNNFPKNSGSYPTREVAIIRNGDSFINCDATGGSLSSNKYEWVPTANQDIYLFKVTYLSNNTDNAIARLIDGALLKFSYNENSDQLRKDQGNKYSDGLTCTFEWQFVKVYPAESEYDSDMASSGTGFAISSDGFIVTNHHVIENANTIKVRGVNGDFSKTYNAKVIADDKNNDLAIIKINDLAFSSLGLVPYTISSKSCDAGSYVFALGYPLKAVMGEEIKLTNGIISSKSGFQGDVTSYQISVPLQPGNSGGPLFDENGNLIGIVNSKLSIGENVSYAIKSSYLTNLIELLPDPPNLTTINLLAGKPLTDQVKLVSDFVYIIEVN